MLSKDKMLGGGLVICLVQRIYQMVSVVGLGLMLKYLGILSNYKWEEVCSQKVSVLVKVLLPNVVVRKFLNVFLTTCNRVCGHPIYYHVICHM